MSIILLFEIASRALTNGNVALALNTKREIDKLTGPGQQLLVQGGLCVKLEVLQALHERGLEPARRMALERKAYFKRRVPLFFLDALAVTAWLEKMAGGGYSNETQKELEQFEICGAIGKQALLEAQGFLI